MGQWIRIGNPDPDPSRQKISVKNGKNEEIFMYDELFVGLDASHGT